MDHTLPDPRRREALGASAAVAALLLAQGLWPRETSAASLSQAFEARSLAELNAALGWTAPVPSAAVTLAGPDIAENGAAVELTLATTLPGARRLLLLVEKNPAVLSALFELGEDVVPEFVIRVKMAQSSNVWAVATTADGRVFYARRDIRVTLGGCAA
jgi:sulfur-oxidizing protein SoxY